MPASLSLNILINFILIKKDCTFPSHSSSVAMFNDDCNHLLWNSFPSKNSHGQQNSHGTGDPQASFAISATSMPLMKIDASCMALKVIQNQMSKMINVLAKSCKLSSLIYLTDLWLSVQKIHGRLVQRMN